MRGLLQTEKGLGKARVLDGGKAREKFYGCELLQIGLKITVLQLILSTNLLLVLYLADLLLPFLLLLLFHQLPLLVQLLSPEVGRRDRVHPGENRKANLKSHSVAQGTESAKEDERGKVSRRPRKKMATFVFILSAVAVGSPILPSRPNVCGPWPCLLKPQRE